MRATIYIYQIFEFNQIFSGLSDVAVVDFSIYFSRRVGKVRQTKHIDRGRPALLAKEIVDDLLFLLSQVSTAHLDEMK